MTMQILESKADISYISRNLMLV